MLGRLQTTLYNFGPFISAILRAQNDAQSLQITYFTGIHSMDYTLFPLLSVELCTIAYFAIAIAYLIRDNI